MSDFQFPPDPPKSPIEKLVVSRRLPNKREFAQYLREQGIDPDTSEKIGRALDQWDADRDFDRVQYLTELETWANIHTHPGETAQEYRLFVERAGAAYLYDAGWVALAPPTLSRTTIRCAELNGLIYSLGEADAAAGGERLFSYDAVSDSWSEHAPHPLSWGHPGLSKLGDLLHQATGYNSTSSNRDRHFQYDPSADTWTEKASAYVTWGAALNYVSAGLYLMGGALTGNASDNNWFWEEDVWDSTTKTIMPSAARHHASCIMPDGIHIIGGEDGGGTAKSNHDVYDPDTDTWTVLTDLPIAYARPIAAGFDTYLLCLADTDLYQWDLDTNTWDLISSAGPISSFNGAAAQYPVP